MLDADVTSGVDEDIEAVVISCGHGPVSTRRPAISRRDVLKYAAAAPAVAGLGGALAGAVSAALAPATASAAPLGILLDYAAGVIPASAIRAAGASGAIRYVSDRRPGGAWMLGKPIQLPEARDLYQSGLKIVSCYQFGKQDSADWLGGQAAGVQHAKRGWQLHVAAGGSYGAPDLRLDRRRPDPRAVQTAGRALSARVGVGARAPAGRRVRQLQDHRLGTAGRPRFVLLATQLGFAQGVHPPGGAPAPGRDRQAQRRVASASTSTTSSSRASASGTRLTDQ